MVPQTAPRSGCDEQQGASASSSGHFPSASAHLNTSSTTSGRFCVPETSARLTSRWSRAKRSKSLCEGSPFNRAVASCFNSCGVRSTMPLLLPSPPPPRPPGEWAREEGSPQQGLHVGRQVVHDGRDGNPHVDLTRTGPRV